MSAFKREDYNSIVRKINKLAANPDSGCDPLPALTEVPEGSQWKKSDIKAAQDRLLEICSENTFSDMPAIWKQFIVKELNTAIERGWCGCDDDDDDDKPCDSAAGKAEDGAEFTVLTQEPEISSYCAGYPNPDDTINLCDYLNGIQVALAGYIGRSYQLYRKFGNSYSGMGGGAVSEAGTISCVGSIPISASHGIAVVCGQACDSQDCAEALARAEQDLTQTPLQYVVRLVAFAAQCPPKEDGGEGEG